MADGIQEQQRPIAVVDVGTTAVRLAIAQMKPDGALETLERLHRPVRLGHSTFLTGRLSQRAMDAAIAVLRDYRRVCDTYRVERVRAVATSAVREATNSDAFLDRALIASGFDIEIIETAEESRLTVMAIRRSLKDVVDVNKGSILVVHIGGGSGLLTVLQDGVIGASESYNLGAVRLQTTLGTAEEPPELAASLLLKHIANFVSAIQRTMPIADIHEFVAAGGDARVAGERCGVPMASSGVHSVSDKALKKFVEQCAQHTPVELSRIYGVSPVDAETLTPALLAYLALLRASGSKRMIVSQVSMSDGLLLDLMSSLSGKEDSERAASIMQSAEAIGEKYHFDRTHSRQVRDIATKLFDALKPVHRLPERSRILLQVAALLHEVGGFVSSRAHHKHSYYLISNSSLFGLRRDEREIVALVSRYHRRSGPRLSHPPYAALTHEDRIIVTKLAALLRVADALDRAHENKVSNFNIHCAAGHCVIKVPDAPDLALERKALERKMDLFEEAFGMKVRVEGEGTPEAPA